MRQRQRGRDRETRERQRQTETHTRETERQTERWGEGVSVVLIRIQKWHPGLSGKSETSLKPRGPPREGAVSAPPQAKPLASRLWATSFPSLSAAITSSPRPPWDVQYALLGHFFIACLLGYKVSSWQAGTPVCVAHGCPHAASSLDGAWPTAGT